MPPNHIKIIFHPDEKKIKVVPGITLIEAAEQAEIYLDTPCGGKGVCGKCRVRITPASLEAEPLNSEFFSESEWNEGWRLACQMVVTRDITVQIPESLRKYPHQILDSGIKVEITPDPNIKKYYITLPPPSLVNQKSDWEILADTLPESILSPQQDLAILSQLPQLLRAAHYQTTAVVSTTGKLLNIEAEDTTAQCYGVAFDIGTTTVVGTLMDLRTGQELAVAADMNAQTVFGADVISRIQHAIQEPNGTKQLHQKIIEVINHLISVLCRKANIKKERIYEITVVGNTTMQHLLLNLSPATLGELPYVPIFKFGLETTAHELDIRAVAPQTLIQVLPNIAGFVGADTVGVILATGTHQSEKIRLIIDLGTNSEIILGNRDTLLCCSAAAGPAFEAAHIEQGMRAASGAIDHVWAENGDIRISTIDNLPPRGICGTGIIDAVAVMLTFGVIESGGRMVNRNQLEATKISRIRDRIVEDPLGNKFMLNEHKNIYLTQRDIREVQLAKAAIATGIQILLDKRQITEAAIDEVLLAGAFGHYILPESVIAIGLIPPSLAAKIVPIGNAASTGAKYALVSLSKRKEAEAIARTTRHLELALQPEFESRFADALSFPEKP
jgi:uncharacterized 2Fe-2S/4Fe-4S cluster protein (DUF4445 family)